MTIDASAAAASVVESLRAQPWGLAVAVLVDGVTEFAIDSGLDEFDEDSLFQIGSITKTVTGLLVAESVIRGETSLETTLGSILGDEAGNCASLTVGDIVTQHSGLPRLPPNLTPDKVDPSDPYASYTAADLIEALRIVERPTPGTHSYSNFGFMLLGLLLTRIGERPYAELAQERVFSPVGMAGAMCGIPTEDERLPGYAGAAQVPWWSFPLPGLGGVACSIRDLARYLEAVLTPSDSMTAAVDLALTAHAQGPPVMGLGWIHQGGGHWHNGGTGGFRSFAAIHRPTRTGIALLVNSHDVDALDKTGLSVLTGIVKGRA